MHACPWGTPRASLNLLVSLYSLSGAQPARAPEISCLAEITNSGNSVARSDTKQAGRLQQKSSPAKKRRALPKYGRQGSSKIIRRGPTLPPSLPGSTIGATGLNFRVRDGNGCFPCAILTEKRVTYGKCRDYNPSSVVISQDKINGQASRPISTGKLNPLLGLHIQPINPVVFRGSLDRHCCR